MTNITEISNTRYNLRRATRARAASLPHSPTAQPGAEAVKNTPIPTTKIADSIRKYSDVVRAGTRSASPAPGSVAVDNPGSRMTSPEYPGAFKLAETYDKSAVEATVPAHSIQLELSENNREIANSPQPMSETEVEPHDPQSWTTVVRKKSRERCARSNYLGPELEKTVREAERNRHIIRTRGFP